MRMSLLGRTSTPSAPRTTFAGRAGLQPPHRPLRRRLSSPSPRRILAGGRSAPIPLPEARMTTETTAPEGVTGAGPELPQERRLVTEIPGPRSRAAHERRTAAVASGVG